MPFESHAGADRRPQRRVVRLTAVLAVACALACGPASAQPSPPWTPDAPGRHDLALLADEAGLDLPLTQWPLPRGAVVRALDALPASLPDALSQARERLRAQLRTHEHSSLRLTLRGHADSLAGFGDDATPGGSAGVRSDTLSTPHLSLQLGARLDAVARPARGRNQLRLDDTALVTEALGLQLQAASHRSWWGPGWQSSLLLGNNAPALSSIGVQRASASRSESPWAAWMGPWNFEFFVAQSEDPLRSYLVGQRLTLRPWPALEIGLSRTAQWGGRGRSHSARGFMRMLLGVGLNVETAQERPNDPAGVMAGFDLRLRCPFGLRCAGYAQLIGEDEANRMPSKYLGLYGVESWSADGRSRTFAEFAETTCGAPLQQTPETPCAYRNGAYPDGYTHAGRWLGAGVGPDSRLFTLGWLDANAGRSLRLHSGQVGSRIGRFSSLTGDPASSGPLLGVSARQSLQWGAVAITAELDWLRVRAPDGERSERRIGAQIRVPLDGATSTVSERLGRSLSLRDGSRLQPLLVGAGLVVGSALFDAPVDDFARNHGDNPSARTLRRVGNALPLAGLGLAGLSWMAQRDTAEGRLALSSVQAGLTALAVSGAAKAAFDRSRPGIESGPTHLGGHKRRTESSFPSTHAALAWALATPYAKHHDMRWLYGAAALTNAARVMGRSHWVSDTVGGAVIGYAIGDYFYNRQFGAANDRGPSIALTPRSVLVNYKFD